MRLRRALITTLLLGVSSCIGPAPESSPYYDLVSGFWSAATETETSIVDFGTSAARVHLASGWSRDRFDSKLGQSFAASTERYSVVRFELFEQRALYAELTGRLKGAARGSRAPVSVEVNGEPVESIAFGRKLRRGRIEIPASVTRVGENRLTLDLGPEYGQGRERAVWYQLDLGTTPADSEATAAPVVLADEKALFIPTGTRLAYPLQVERGTSWRAEQIEMRSARLGLALETDDGGRRNIATVAATGPAVVEVESTDRPAALLILEARPTDLDSAGGVLIKGPALWAPRSPSPPRRRSARSRERPNVLLYLVDTLRRDRLGCYGYSRPVSPNIDAFAARATLFERSIGQSSWTKPSVGSIFTGLWPPAHGVVGWRKRLPIEIDTLAEKLQATGYRTAALVGNPHVTNDQTYHQGFDQFDEIGRPDSKRLTELADTWLAGVDGEQPFFLMVHTMDPHAVYWPPQPYRDRFAPEAASVAVDPTERWTPEARSTLSELYDGEIAYNDANFGALLSVLEERGLYEGTLVIFVSDHGEEFLEHRWWRHGATLHAESLNVPLIVKFPGQTAGQVVKEPVQHIDLLPTVLDSLGLPIPADLEGISLAKPQALSSERPIYSHLRNMGERFLSVVSGDWKLIERYDGTRTLRTLFHSRTDSGESRDLSRELPIRTAVLAAMLQAKWLDTEPPPPTEELVADEEFKQELRALGYLQ